MNLDYLVWCIIATVLLFAMWIVICYCTRIRFVKGNFYYAHFVKGSGGWTLDMKTVIKPNKRKIRRFFAQSAWYKPNAVQRISVGLGDKRADFETQKSGSMFDSIPFLHIKGRNNIQQNILTDDKIFAIINDDTSVSFSTGELNGNKIQCEKSDKLFYLKMDLGVVISEVNNSTTDKTIVFFVSEKQEKELQNSHGDK